MKQIFILLGFITFSIGCTSDDIGNDSSLTQTGSYSTMVTIDQYLYLVNKTEISTFDIKDPNSPNLLDKQNVGFDIESIYHYENLLLIGSANNMYIFSISGNHIPKRESTTSYNTLFGSEVCTHDPIVVRNNLAYVTISTSDIFCGNIRNFNHLKVYNITDIKTPVLLLTKDLKSPKGLALGKNQLYVCDQIDGLVVLDISVPENPMITKIFDGFEGYDAIVKNDLLIVVAKDQLRQYDISDESNIKLISKLDL